jgi:hypothetical protein
VQEHSRQDAAPTLVIPASCIRYHRGMETKVESFEDLMHAEIFAGLLREHDIPARVENTHTLSANGLWGQALGHFKVMVPNAHVLEARGMLSRWRNGEFALDDSADPGTLPQPSSG